VFIVCSPPEAAHKSVFKVADSVKKAQAAIKVELKMRGTGHSASSGSRVADSEGRATSLDG
jgi:hypothetical protein